MSIKIDAKRKTKHICNDIPLSPILTVSEIDVHTATHLKSKKLSVPVFHSDIGTDSSTEKTRRGTLTPELIQYFRNIADVLETNEFSTDEDRVMLVSNVIEETRGHEYHLTRSASCSPTIEKILNLCSSLQLRRFFSALNGKFLELCTDRCASHVIEALLCRVPALLAEQQLQNDDKAPIGLNVDTIGDGDTQMPPESIVGMFEKMMEELRYKWVELMKDTHGSFLVRRILSIIAGHNVVVEFGATSAASSAAHTASLQLLLNAPSAPIHLPPSWPGTLDQITSALLECDGAASHLMEHAHEAVMSPCIQSLLETLFVWRRFDTIDTLCAGLLSWTTHAPDLANNLNENSHELEAVKIEPVPSAPESDQSLSKRSREVQSGLNRRVLRHVRQLVCDRSGSHLIEAILKYSSLRLFSLFNRHHLLGSLFTLARHAVANFVVQAMFTRMAAGVPALFNPRKGDDASAKQEAHNKSLENIRDMMSSAVQELVPLFSILLESQRGAIVWKMLEACAKLRIETSTVAKATFSAIASAFPQTESTPTVDNTIPTPIITDLLYQFLYLPSGISVKEATGVDSGKSNIVPKILKKAAPIAVGHSPVGVSLIMALLQFPPEDCKPILERLLSCDVSELVSLACDRLTSRVLEQLLTSVTVRPQQKKHLLKRLKGQFVELALDRCGSFIVEKCYAVSDSVNRVWLSLNRSRTAIVQELSLSSHKLGGSHSGRLLMKSLKIDDFKRRGTEWTANQRVSEKTKRLFSDITGDGTEADTATSHVSHTSVKVGSGLGAGLVNHRTTILTGSTPPVSHGTNSKTATSDIQNIEKRVSAEVDNMFASLDRNPNKKRRHLDIVTVSAPLPKIEKASKKAKKSGDV